MPEPLPRATIGVEGKALQQVSPEDAKAQLLHLVEEAVKGEDVFVFVYCIVSQSAAILAERALRKICSPQILATSATPPRAPTSPNSPEFG